MINQIKSIIPRPIGYLVREIYLFFRGYLYFGNKIYCPLCGHSFRKMIPGGFNLEVNQRLKVIGAGRRKNVVCPACASSDRDRLLFAYFENNQNLLTSETRVLHIAPEPELSRYLSRKVNSYYVSGMKYHEGFYYSRNVVLFDILQLPFENNAFGLVVCNHVLEHIENEKLALSEIMRVLKPGGSAILQVPWSPLLDTTYENSSVSTKADREKYFGQFDHVRLYGKDYPNRLQLAGFEVNVSSFAKSNLTKDDAVKIAINPDEIIFVASKPL
jgi:SAM-dependent methyltransferase